MSDIRNWLPSYHMLKFTRSCVTQLLRKMLAGDVVVWLGR